MEDLHSFDNGYFDFIVHPASNVFVENVLPVWKEAARVLKNKGILISGFTNPLLYIFDEEMEVKGRLEVRHSIPYSSVSDKAFMDNIENNQAHTSHFMSTVLILATTYAKNSFTKLFSIHH